MCVAGRRRYLTLFGNDSFSGGVKMEELHGESIHSLSGGTNCTCVWEMWCNCNVHTL